MVILCDIFTYYIHTLVLYILVFVCLFVVFNYVQCLPKSHLISSSTLFNPLDIGNIDSSQA